MKIEIAENMLYSWLRHCEHCQIVQTNFKTWQEWTPFDKEKVKSLFKKFQEYPNFANYIFKSKKNLMNLDSVLRASECDLVAIHFDNDSTTVYAVESAFHENGMLYKNNTKKVLQKLFRSYLVLCCYFQFNNVELIFATPSVKERELNNIRDEVKKLEEFIHAESSEKVKVRFIANKDYKSEIIDKLEPLVDKIADTSELFIRSMLLEKRVKQLT